MNNNNYDNDDYDDDDNCKPETDFLQQPQAWTHG
jgi:hypothetical protein